MIWNLTITELNWIVIPLVFSARILALKASKSTTFVQGIILLQTTSRRQGQLLRLGFFSIFSDFGWTSHFFQIWQSFNAIFLVFLILFCISPFLWTIQKNDWLWHTPLRSWSLTVSASLSRVKVKLNFLVVFTAMI